jgi:biotin carboxyl carrier protein
MLKVKVNEKDVINLEFVGKELNSGTIEGKEFNLDLIEVKNGSFHILKDNRSYNVEVLKAEQSTKTFTIRVNNNIYRLEIKDKYDELLHQLGMDNIAGAKVSEIKAPMPGLVLNIIVEEGSVVKKGDPILVLEAMKMENILKSPADGTVKKINVKKGVAVEKNQVLISFI